MGEEWGGGDTHKTKLKEEKGYEADYVLKGRNVIEEWGMEKDQVFPLCWMEDEAQGQDSLSCACVSLLNMAGM